MINGDALKGKGNIGCRGENGISTSREGGKSSDWANPQAIPIKNGLTSKGAPVRRPIVALKLAGVTGGRAAAVNLIGLALLALMVISLAASLKSAVKPDR